jgi:AraC-like DNA-binding protein
VVTKSTGNFDVDRDDIWHDAMFSKLIDRVEHWIRPKMAWDRDDSYDRYQVALDVVYAVHVCLSRNKSSWTIGEMVAMCSTVADRKVIDAIRNAKCTKNLLQHTFLCDAESIERLAACAPVNCKSCCQEDAEFQESVEHVWSLFDSQQKRVVEQLVQNKARTLQQTAKDLGMSERSVRRVRDDAIRVAYRFLDVRLAQTEQRAESREQRAESNSIDDREN